MTGVNQSAPWTAKVARCASIFLFSLNVAWVTVWYMLQRTSLCNNWPLQGDVPVMFHWHFWMPEPGAVLRQVAYSFVVGIVFSLVLFLLARVSAVSAVLRVIAGVFAITEFPLFALSVPDEVPRPKLFLLYEPELMLVTIGVLACGVLYYLRRWPVPTAVSVLMLASHFGLWAWVTGNYVSPFVLISAFPPQFRMSVVQVGLRVCIMTIYHNGFPAIGFLSALSSGLDIKLSSGRTPRAAAAA